MPSRAENCKYEKLSTHGGSLRVYLKKENTESKGSNLVEKILKEEKILEFQILTLT